MLAILKKNYPYLYRGSTIGQKILKMRKIIIRVTPWQTCIAVLKEGHLQNIYFSSSVSSSLERSFFKGTVNKVLPGIQTAFVDIGQTRAGFLHISEIDRELALQRMTSTVELEDVKPRSKKSDVTSSPDMHKILIEGEHILVQVSKEPVYEKGAKLTTCFTLPGRFLVLMPNIPRVAISKKIDDRQERARLKEIIAEYLPENMGAIIRTTCLNRDASEIINDLKYLISSWKKIQRNFQKADPTEKIYEDLPIPLRAIRDHLDTDVDSIVIDDKKMYLQIYKFVKYIAPEHIHCVKHYTGKQDLFERFEINKQLDQALALKVNLKSGGSIIIEQTQAMTVIDVNTGKYLGKSNLENTILQTNLDAAEEIVRQLRLRNIGGLIVIDFIDMAFPSNRQRLVRFFEKTLKEEDKFQSVVLKVSEFGIIQMTRKRSGKTLLQELCQECACCKGTGVIKSTRTQTYEILERLNTYILKNSLKKVTVRIHPNIFNYLTSIEYNAILNMEKQLSCKVTLLSDEHVLLNEYTIKQE